MTQFIPLEINFHRNRKRLLHPGADTKDILTQYVSMIRCLRIIDPPGVLLHKVADPVRRYLRSVILKHVHINCYEFTGFV